MTNENHFLKTISQWECNYDLFTNLPRIIVLTTFLRVHLNSKEVSFLSWQNVSYIENYFSYQVRFFLWTKLLKTLLLAKYLISVAAPLSLRYFQLFAQEVCKFQKWAHAHISKSERCFNVKSSTYCFHLKTKFFANFQICISVPLMNQNISFILYHTFLLNTSECLDKVFCKISNLHQCTFNESKHFIYSISYFFIKYLWMSNISSTAIA